MEEAREPVVVVESSSLRARACQEAVMAAGASAEVLHPAEVVFRINEGSCPALTVVGPTLEEVDARRLIARIRRSTCRASTSVIVLAENLPKGKVRELLEVGSDSVLRYQGEEKLLQAKMTRTFAYLLGRGVTRDA